MCLRITARPVIGAMVDRIWAVVKLVIPKELGLASNEIGQVPPDYLYFIAIVRLFEHLPPFSSDLARVKPLRYHLTRTIWSNQIDTVPQHS